MREIRPSGSEGGVTFKPPSLPLSATAENASAEMYGARRRGDWLLPRRDHGSSHRLCHWLSDFR